MAAVPVVPAPLLPATVDTPLLLPPAAALLCVEALTPELAPLLALDAFELADPLLAGALELLLLPPAAAEELGLVPTATTWPPETVEEPSEEEAPAALAL